MRLSPKDLIDHPEFEFLFRLEHKNIKEFVKEQFRKKSRITKRYLWYQFSMATLLVALITSGLLLWYVKSTMAILFVIGAFCFSFTLLIFIHELLHGFAFLLLGFKKFHFEVISGNLFFMLRQTNRFFLVMSFIFWLFFRW